MKSIEERVREAFEAQGLTAERIGGEEMLAMEVRAEVRRLELSQGSTRPGSASSGLSRPSVLTSADALKTAQKRARSEETDTERRESLKALNAQREAERIASAACSYCADQRAIRVTSDPGDWRFGKSFPCPECVSIEERMAHAGAPQRYRTADVATMRRLPGKEPAIRYIAEQWDGRESVIIASRKGDGDSKWGTGKTLLACAMARKVIEARRYPRFWYVPDLMDGIRSRFNADDGMETADDFQDHVARETFLVLDDLGAERPTPWTMERLSVLLNERYNARRSTVITTNYTTAEEIAEAVGGAVASRLKTYQWLLVGGADLRGKHDGR